MLIVLAGGPASGKSTLARRLAVRLPAALVQSDAVRKALVAQPRYTAEEHRRVFAVAHGRLARRLREGTSVVFDATNLEEGPRRGLYRLAAACGARLVVARLAVPEALARLRLERRALARDADDLSDADWAVYQALMARFEPIAVPHWVLNGAADPDALADLLVRQARGGGLARRKGSDNIRRAEHGAPENGTGRASAASDVSPGALVPNRAT